MHVRTAVFAVAALSLAACQDDVSAEKKSWEETTAAWQVKVDKLTAGLADLTGKAKELKTADPALDGALSAAQSSLDAAKAAIASTKTSIEVAIAAGKKVPLQAALSSASAPVDGLLTKADSLVSAAGTALEAANTKAQADAATADAAAAEAAVADKFAQDLKTPGATVTFGGIYFNGANIDGEKSKDGLAAMLAAFQAPGFKADVFVSAKTKDAGQRAGNLKIWLYSKGAKAAVGKVDGKVNEAADESITVTVVSPAN